MCVCVRAGRSVLLRLLRRACRSGEDPRGEGASRHPAGVCQEAELSAAGGDGLSGQVRHAGTGHWLHVSPVIGRDGLREQISQLERDLFPFESLHRQGICFGRKVHTINNLKFKYKI